LNNQDILTEYSDILAKNAPYIMIQNIIQNVENFNSAGGDIGQIVNNSVYQELKQHDEELVQTLEDIKKLSGLKSTVDDIAQQINNGMKAKNKNDKKEFFQKAKNLIEIFALLAKVSNDPQVQSTMQWLTTQVQEKIDYLLSLFK